MTLHVVQRNVVQVRHVGAYIHIYVLHRTPPTCVHICAPLYSTPLHLHVGWPESCILPTECAIVMIPLAYNLTTMGYLVKCAESLTFLSDEENGRTCHLRRALGTGLACALSNWPTARVFSASRLPARLMPASLV